VYQGLPSRPEVAAQQRHLKSTREEQVNTDLGFRVTTSYAYRHTAVVQTEHA